MGLLRSLAFGVAVLVVTVLLLVANIGVWAMAGLQDAPTFARLGSTALERPEVRGLIARRVAERLAPLVVAAGPLDPAVRRALGVPARPTVAEMEGAMRRQLDAFLDEPGAVAALGIALAGLHDEVASWMAAGLLDRPLALDIGSVVGAYVQRLDATGTLVDRLPADVGRLALVDPAATSVLGTVIGPLGVLRWLLPMAIVVAVVSLLVLARFRAHALSWVGLSCVVVGTTSLLLASGAPLVAPRLVGADNTTGVALTGALEVLTAGLITQSAVIAVVGLAMVVAGIAAASVTADRDDAVMAV